MRLFTQLVSKLLIFFWTGTMAVHCIAQSASYTTDEYPSLSYYNPGSIAFHRNFSAFSTVLSQFSSAGKPVFSAMSGIDGMLSPLRTGINLSFRTDQFANKDFLNGYHIGFSFMAITRGDEMLGVGIGLTYNTLRLSESIGFGRFDLFQSDSLINSLPGRSYFWNVNTGIHYHHRSMSAGLSVRNILAFPTFSDHAKINPGLFGSFSKEVRLFKTLFRPELAFQVKSKSVTDANFRSYMISDLDFADVKLLVQKNDVAAGADIRFTEQLAPTFYISGGVKSNRIELALSAGLMNIAPSETQNCLAILSQFTFSYAIARSRMGHRYRLKGTSRWSGFLGGGSYSNSNSQSGSVRSSYGYLSNTPQSVSVITRFDDGVKGGTLTAVEVNDFAKWELWDDISANELASSRSVWKMFPSERFSVILINASGGPAIDIPVFLCSETGDTIWKSRTDNLGRAELWCNMFLQDMQPKSIIIMANDEVMVTEDIVPFSQGVNIISVPVACKRPMVIDLCFVVDATGSMADEISYLQKELDNIIGAVGEENGQLKVRTGSLFYRCYQNEYVTRVSDFSEDFSKTRQFISNQNAGEGGIEAVEVALYDAAQKMSWSQNANTRLLFIVLDETPAYTPSVIDSMHQVTEMLSGMGVHVIPLIASGATRDLEYLMRSVALATGGTSVFLSDHSGVGDSHISPVTDQVSVEYLNKLILRLISQYAYIPSCTESYDEAYRQANDTSYIEIVVASKTALSHDSVFANPEDMQDEDTIPNFVSDDTMTQSDSSAFVQDSLVATIQYYPNPTAGVVHIQTSSSIIHELFLFDANHKILQRIQVSDSGYAEIDLSLYPDGTYYLKCRTADQWHEGKIVLIH